MVGAVLLEKIIVKGGVAQLPGVPQKPPDLLFGQLESIFPDVAVFNVSILLHLQIIRNCGKIAPVSAGDPADGIEQALILRDGRGVVDGIGQDARLLGLPLLIDPEKGMPEHGGRVVHEGGGKDQRDRFWIEFRIPCVEAFTGLRRKATVVKRELLLEPVIAGDESTLCRLAGASGGLAREKPFQGGFKLGLGIRPAVRGEEERLVIGLAGIPAPCVLPIVQEEVPKPFLGQLRASGLTDQVSQVLSAVGPCREGRLADIQNDEDTEQTRGLSRHGCGGRHCRELTGCEDGGQEKRLPAWRPGASLVLRNRSEPSVSSRHWRGWDGRPWRRSAP